MKDVINAEGVTTNVEFEVLPRRTSEGHFDVSSFVKPPKCTDCVKFQTVEFTPGATHSYIVATVFLKNPTALTGYDVRGIIYPPSTDQAELRDKLGYSTASGFTTLYPEPGNPLGKNPYMAFFDTANPMFRPFPGKATLGATYKFKKNNSYKLVTMVYKVDASYPTNAPEPVDAYIYPLTDNDRIYPQGSNAVLLARITDWQDNVVSVTLDLTSFGLTGSVPMAKLSDDPANHTSLWQYVLTAGAGQPTGLRTIRLAASSSDSPLVYYKDFEVKVTYDYDPPSWKETGKEGIYDAICGPQNIWIFFHEAWDVSLPLQYVFWGNSQSPPYSGSVLKVVTNDQYTGYTPFSGPENTPYHYGIQLQDSPGFKTNWDGEWVATRYTATPRWSILKGQPPGQDGIMGSPAIGDVNGDGMKDIVVGTRDTKVYVFRGNGTGTQDTIIWEYKTGGEVQGTPALVDLNGDKKLDVVVGSDDCNVYALNGNTGLPLWVYDTGDGFLIHGSPAIAQLNSGAPDVIIGTGGGTLFALNGENGGLIWSYTAGGGIAGTPAVADVSGDGVPDVCFGAYDTRVHMVNGATGKAIWTYYIGAGMNNVDNSPVMVDISGDNIPDCVIGARHGAAPETGALYAIDGWSGGGPDGLELWIQESLWGNTRRPVAPAKINGDDVWDFVVTSYQTEEYSFYAINGANGQILYRKLGPDIPSTDPFNYSAPIVGDFTGDGHMDILYARQDGYCDLANLADFDLPGDWPGRHLFKMQVSTGNKLEIFGTPAIEDVDGDGEWELIACNMRGYIYVLDLHAPVPSDIHLRGWTMHQGNRWNTGVPEFVPPDE